jgi:hypothetical protein
VTRPRDLEFTFWECQRLASQADVVEVVELIAGFGLVPGRRGGPAWTREGRTPEPVPFSDIPAAVEAAHHLTIAGEQLARGERASPLSSAEWWRFGLVHREHPHIPTTVTIGPRVGGQWDISLYVYTPGHTDQGLSLEAFCASWGPLLEQVGDALYARARPALGAITNTKDEIIGFPGLVNRRRMLVGWRTWYGPAYVETFGRDFLLGLPDRAQPLDDGGVRHALDAPALALAQHAPDLYASVWPYLDGAGVEPAWPRARRRGPRRGPSREELDRELTAFRRDMVDLLTFTITLEDNQRVKGFAPDWDLLADPKLGQARRALVLRSVREAAERELREHPEAQVRFELGPDAPQELRRLLDELAETNPRLSHIVLPGQN